MTWPATTTTILSLFLSLCFNETWLGIKCLVLDTVLCRELGYCGVRSSFCCNCQSWKVSCLTTPTAAFSNLQTVFTTLLYRLVCVVNVAMCFFFWKQKNHLFLVFIVKRWKFIVETDLIFHLHIYLCQFNFL